MIYFVECGAYIKIGFTETTIERRLKSLATSNPYPLKLLFTMIGNQATERHLHKRLRNFRHQLEWFIRSPEFFQQLEIVLKEMDESTRKLAAEATALFNLSPDEEKIARGLYLLSSGVQT